MAGLVIVGIGVLLIVLAATGAYQSLIGWQGA